MVVTQEALLKKRSGLTYVDLLNFYQVEFNFKKREKLGVGKFYMPLVSLCSTNRKI